MTKRVEALLAAAMALSLCGCIFRPKPKTVAAPPAPPQPVAAAPAPPLQPLSIPQTRVELPAPQPVSPDALPPPPPAEASTEAPAPHPKRVRTNPPAAPKPEPPAQPVPEQPLERAPIQEVVPQEELKRLQDSAQNARIEVTRLIAQAHRRRLNKDERSQVDRILQFVKLSEQSQNSGDMRGADELAQRALVLARGLQRER